MILNFKTKFPWGTLTYFKEKILELPEFKPKLHTIREGYRWRSGNFIHFSTGARTNNYQCFQELFCLNTQDIVITKLHIDLFEILIDNNIIFIGHRDEALLNTGGILGQLIKNDGFETVADFFRFFDTVYFKKGRTTFEGQIIHWTNLKY